MRAPARPAAPGRPRLAGPWTPGGRGYPFAAHPARGSAALTFVDRVNLRLIMSQSTPSYPLLGAIESPADLRALAERDLPAPAAEMREFLIQTVSTRGGHFAAGLGTVELTIALHYVFDTPEDRLVWDVGHQAYPHKVLTGRRDRLFSIKQHQGLAPFPTRSESPYDAFGVGHSSTSIGAALGMSIAENVGALSNYLARVIASPLYAQLRESGRRALRQMPAVRKLARRSEEH